MIDILMASYNNEKYISDQIDSILKQTYKDWRLLIQDDCSTDGTYSILKKYQALHPGKILITRNLQNSGGAKNNFFSVLPLATDSYVMLSDGDDYWKPDKIQLTLEKMKSAETKYGDETPILIHTDLEVVDEELKLIAKSMFKRQKLDPNRDKLNQLLVQNVVTGCTCMMNRNLMSILLGVLAEKSDVAMVTALMHDWWIAITAAAFGRIEYLKESTVLYRQHRANSVGAKDAQSINYILGQLSNKSQIKSTLRRTFLQANEFNEIYQHILPREKKLILSKYQEVSISNKAKKIILIYKYGFLKKGILRVIGQLLYI